MDGVRTISVKRSQHQEVAQTDPGFANDLRQIFASEFTDVLSCETVQQSVGSRTWPSVAACWYSWLINSALNDDQENGRFVGGIDEMPAPAKYIVATGPTGQRCLKRLCEGGSHYFLLPAVRHWALEILVGLAPMAAVAQRYRK